MKKSLITLFALAGMACATEEIWSTGFAVESDGTWTTAQEDLTKLQSSEWILKAADGSDLLSTTKDTTELRPNTNVGSSQGWTLSFTLTNTSTESVSFDSLVFDTVIFNATGDYQSSNTNRDFVFTLSYGENSLSTGNYTIGGNGTSAPTNGVVAFTLAEAITLSAGENLAITLNVAKGTSNAGCYLGLKTVTAYIPEPSTVTLSLLALAGLAVRRRRK